MSKHNNPGRHGAAHVSRQASAARSYEQKANRLYRDEKLDRAIALLRQAATQSPDNAKLQHKLGLWLSKQKHVDEGIQCYRKALEIDADFAPALIDLAQALGKKNHFDEAVPLVEKALELEPDNASGHLVYGVLKQRQGELDDAVLQFRTSLELRLQHPPRTGRPGKKKKDFNQPATEALLWTTLSTLAKAGVHAFAAFGTLLGLTREGGLLPFDKDIDLGIPNSEMRRACEVLEANGWIEMSDVQPHMINPIPFYHPLEKITLDVSGFVVDRVASRSCEGVWWDNVPWEDNRITEFPPLELEKATSPDDQPIWSLRDPEQWLDVLYGDWRTPDPDFDTIIAARNLRGFSLLTQSYAFSRIHEKWQNGQIGKARALVRHSRRHLPDDTLLRRLDTHFEALQAEAATAAA
ncbi:MAG TPA: tetratricopeptide repeat protein [Oleiagrimonas sp.]|nr:tetratricopeptide repeat protein [Oleiagrimonas sp.]